MQLPGQNISNAEALDIWGFVQSMPLAPWGRNFERSENRRPINEARPPYFLGLFSVTPPYPLPMHTVTSPENL